METITNAIDLKEAIRQLESDKVEQGLLLKEAFFQSIIQINPINLLDEQLNQTSPFSLGGHSFVEKLVGVLSGFLIKKWITGKSGNPIRKVVGSIIQVLATTLISHQSEKLFFLGRLLVQSIFSKAHTDHDND